MPAQSRTPSLRGFCSHPVSNTLPGTVKLLVLLNPAAGTPANSSDGDRAERIRTGFAAAGAEVEVREVEGKALDSAVARAVRGRHDAVIGGGGDGTLNTIAAALAGTETAFGVLPL